MLKIIAECGVNWNGIIKNAYKMIRKSKEAGADYVKFQIFKEEHIKDHPESELLGEMILDIDIIEWFYEYSKKIGIEIFFTPFFPEAVDWLEDIDISIYKIRFKDNRNYDLIKKCYMTKKPVLLSCNYPYFSYRKLYHCKLLYCVPKYPAKYMDYFPLSTDFHGISDHTPDLGLLKFVAQNMTSYEYFEKHVKLDNDCIESDWSVSFEELSELIKKIKKGCV